LSLLLVQHFASPDASLGGRVLAGITIAVPIFIKQNVGLAFFGLTCGVLLLLATIEVVAQRRMSGYGAILIGALIGLTTGALLIESVAGLGNYVHWTIDYAASQRLPTITDMLEVYKAQSLPISLVCFAIGALLLWWGRTALWGVLSALLVAAPFAWPALYLLVEADPAERADRLLDLWPALLVASLLVGVLSLGSRRGPTVFLPFILFGTINAGFMSQQLWGSTYAIWPLFVILVASSLVSLLLLSKAPSSWFTLTFSLAFTVSLLIAGGAYVWSHERLDYAKLDRGNLAQATLPELKGLATRGRWIPDFEQLVAYIEREIPREDAILLLPDEDLFYYTTQREPRMPVLLAFDYSNPYAPEEVLNLSRDLQVRWLIVKHEIQTDDADMNSIEQQLAKVLRPEFRRIKKLRNYDVYRRR
jgi:hypothetical protein